MNLVFTGTRHGMTFEQKQSVEHQLRVWKSEPRIQALYHGGCMGADWDFHQLVCRVWSDSERLPHGPLMVLVCPSTLPKTYPRPIRVVMEETGGSLEKVWTAFGATVVTMPAHPLARNKSMLRSALVDTEEARLLATPRKGDEERVRHGRGGTLATIRAALGRGVASQVVAFDGRLVDL